MLKVMSKQHLKLLEKYVHKCVGVRSVVASNVAPHAVYKRLKQMLSCEQIFQTLQVSVGMVLLESDTVALPCVGVLLREGRGGEAEREVEIER